MESYTIVQKILASRRQTPEKKSPIPFRFQCRCSRDGKIHMKEETGPSGKNSFTYSYDVAGHLEAVRKNGLLVEQYTYDDQGRRIGDFRAWDGEPRDFIYNYDGALIRVNDTYMDWTPAGRLKSVYSASSRTEYEFGRDTRLDRVLLPSGNVVEYRYAKGLMPVAILEDSAPVAECAWEDILGLKKYSDYKDGLDYEFVYADGGIRFPRSVILKSSAENMYRLTGIRSQCVEAYIAVDQVGSIRALSLRDGRMIKYLEYDAFGNVIADTRTSLRFPLGFAGGLNDFATGFVRFGFRDYDPQTGRFTAKDPAGDTGGDHDLWDYCVDDPVGRIDPLGLEDRSTWDRFWAWYSPLLFGNDEERNAARDSLHRSLKKEAEALAGGYVDAMTILSVPTSMGTWATESLIDSDRSNDLRENFLRYKNNKEKPIFERE